MELMNLPAALRRFACLTLSFVLIILGNPAVAESNKKLDFVSYSDPPYIFEQQGKVVGLVVDYVEELMRRIDYKYSIKVVPPKRALIIAASKPNTCVFPIERSQEREVKFKWVSPILISRYGFFGQEGKDYRIQVLNDAKAYTIGSYLGSSIGEYLASLGFSVDLAPGNEANLHKLRAGRIGLWASDIVSAQYIAKKNDFVLSPSELGFFTTLRAMGCNRGVSDVLIAKLNKALQSMYQDGTIISLKKNANY